MSNKMDTVKILLPKLRFSEFQNSPAWKKTPLEDAVSPVVRQVEKPETPYTSLGIRSHGKGTFLKPLQSPEKNAMEYLYEVQSDDLIVNITFAWEGAIAIVKKGDTGALVSHRFPTYTFNRDNAIPEFFQYVILDKRFIYNLGVISPGGAGRNRVLNKNDFLKLTVSVPSTAEQQKIAGCLTSLDDLITVQSQKVETLQTYKKGLMQNLFPAEGESVPRLRFPEFESAGEWEDKELTEIVDDFIVPMRDKPKDLKGEIPWCRIEDFDGMYLAKSKTNQGVSQATIKSMNLKVYPIGTVLVSCSADLGKCAITATKLITNQTFIGLVPKISKVNNIFLYYVMINSKNKLNELSSGTTIAYLSRQAFEKFKVYLPKMKEQQRIAELLTAIDEQISAQREKVAALKVHKKGLMQGLFPSMNEVQE